MVFLRFLRRSRNPLRGSAFCGNRRGRGAKTHGLLRCLTCSRDPLRESAWSRCKNPFLLARQSQGAVTLCLEGVSQMDSIPPGRLLALSVQETTSKNSKPKTLRVWLQHNNSKTRLQFGSRFISSEPTFAGLTKKEKKKKGVSKKGSEKKREKGFPLAKLDIA